jgi:hypothetical protein
MILLPTSLPKTTADLVACLSALLAQAISAGDGAVSATGEFPAVQSLSIDLTGASPLEPPHAQWLLEAGGTVGSFTVADLRVTGHPFGTGGRAVDLDLSAQNCRGDFVDAPGGKFALRLAKAANGRLRVATTKSAIEAILRAEGGKQAAAHGVDVKDVQMSLKSEASRHLAADVQIKAKKGFFPAATIRVRGNLQVDDKLNARLSGLSVDGEGMVGGIAAGFLRPRMTQLEGKSWSLLGLPLDGIEVRDVRLTVAGDQIAVDAEFAG